MTVSLITETFVEAVLVRRTSLIHLYYVADSPQFSVQSYLFTFYSGRLAGDY